MQWLLAWAGLWIVLSLLTQTELREVAIAIAYMLAITGTFFMFPVAQSEISALFN